MNFIATGLVYADQYQAERVAEERRPAALIATFREEVP